MQRVLEGKNRGNGKQAIFNENFQDLGGIVSSEHKHISTYKSNKLKLKKNKENIKNNKIICKEKTD